MTCANYQHHSICQIRIQLDRMIRKGQAAGALTTLEPLREALCDSCIKFERILEVMRDGH